MINAQLQLLKENLVCPNLCSFNILRSIITRDSNVCNFIGLAGGVGA
jgi:hypothetical protein